MRTLFERHALLHGGVADAVGLARKLDEPPAVDDAVNHGSGHLVVPEHRSPPVELQVRGNHH